jgi:hypothetical protein
LLMPSTMVKENAGLQRLAQADLVDILLFLVMFEIFGFPSYLDIFLLLLQIQVVPLHLFLMCC